MQLRCNVNQAPLEGSGSPEAEAAAEGAGWGSPSLHTCEKSPIPSSPGAQQGGNVISGRPGSRKLLETPARKQACLQRNHYSLRLAAAEGSGSSPGKAQPVVSIYTQPREQRAQQQVVLGKRGLCQQELCSRQPCGERGAGREAALLPPASNPLLPHPQQSHRLWRRAGVITTPLGACQAWREMKCSLLQAGGFQMA